MICGELSLESPPFLHVTWKIPVFFQLAKESGYSLESPEFPFADCRYCLRLFPSRVVYNDSYVHIKLVNLTDTVPGTDVSYEVGLKSRAGKEIDIDRRGASHGREFRILRSEIENKRDCYFPDSTFTVFCSVRLREPSSAASPKFGWTDTLGFSNVGLSSSQVTIHDFRMSGELSIESPPFLHVTWKISDFFELVKKSGYSLESPEFPFADDRYCLRLFFCHPLYGAGSSKSGRIELVNLTDTVPGTDVSFEVGLKSRTGEEIDIDRIIKTPEHLPGILTCEQGRSHDKISFTIERSKLEDKINSYVPDGTLTAFCFVRLREQSNAEGPKSGGAEISDEEEEEKGLPGVAKLQSDYRQLLKKGAERDACLVVSGKEFRAHKNILRARSPVFEAMFGHETAEKSSGRVVIEDLDPESFGDFLEYLYTGGVEAGLSDDNAFGLYAAADKYDVPTLKSECLAHMRRNLSVDSFCDVITLALRHQEEKLLQRAVIFFKKNMARIIVTVKWQQFVIDNGTSANELLIKAVVPGGQ